MTKIGISYIFLQQVTHFGHVEMMKVIHLSPLA